MAEALYQVKVTLLDCHPPIWRRVIVDASVTLKQLHSIIQAAVGWEDYHLYQFEVGGAFYGEPDPTGIRADLRAAGGMRLSSVLRSAGDKVVYVYDFGDEWRHEVLLEDLPTNEYKTTPICLDGRGASPPEDSGGPYLYTDYLQQLASDEESDRSEAQEVLGEDFDPERFDLDAVNRRLKTALSRRR